MHVFQQFKNPPLCIMEFKRKGHLLINNLSSFFQVINKYNILRFKRITRGRQTRVLQSNISRPLKPFVLYPQTVGVARRWLGHISFDSRDVNFGGHCISWIMQQKKVFIHVNIHIHNWALRTYTVCRIMKERTDSPSLVGRGEKACVSLGK